MLRFEPQMSAFLAKLGLRATWQLSNRHQLAKAPLGKAHQEGFVARLFL